MKRRETIVRRQTCLPGSLRSNRSDKKFLEPTSSSLLVSRNKPAMPSIHYSPRADCHLGHEPWYFSACTLQYQCTHSRLVPAAVFAPQLPTSNSLSLASYSAPGQPRVSAQPSLPGRVPSLARRRSLAHSCVFRSRRSGETDGARSIAPVPTRAVVCPHLLPCNRLQANAETHARGLPHPTFRRRSFAISRCIS